MPCSGGDRDGGHSGHVEEGPGDEDAISPPSTWRSALSINADAPPNAFSLR